MSIQIQVPQPCHASWDKMSPQPDGRHCKSCDKVVVDFSRMNDEEIKDWFRKKEGEKVCGHFRVDQVKRLQIVVKPKEFKQLGWSPVQMFRVAIFLVFFSSLFSCSPNPENGGAMTEIVIDEQKNHADGVSGLMLSPPLEIDTPITQTITIETITGDSIYPIDTSRYIPMVNGGLTVPTVESCVKGEVRKVPDVIEKDTITENSYIKGKVMPPSMLKREAEFPGGANALQRWILQNAHYPEVNRARMFQGEVVTLVSISDKGKARIINYRSPENVPDCFQREVERLLIDMPTWQAAILNGKNVNSEVEITFPFSLGD